MSYDIEWLHQAVLLKIKVTYTVGASCNNNVWSIIKLTLIPYIYSNSSGGYHLIVGNFRWCNISQNILSAHLKIINFRIDILWSRARTPYHVYMMYEYDVTISSPIQTFAVLIFAATNPSAKKKNIFAPCKNFPCTVLISFPFLCGY